MAQTVFGAGDDDLLRHPRFDVDDHRGHEVRGDAARVAFRHGQKRVQAGLIGLIVRQGDAF